MARKPSNAAPAAPAPAAPVIQNAAPGYDPYRTQPPGGVTAPGGPYGPPAASNGSVSVTPTAPPPVVRNPFVNAQFLYQFGGPIQADILGIRAASGGNSKYGDKRGWFLDVRIVKDGTLATGRINEGDQRHQRLWAAYQAAWVGKRVTLRLPAPPDNTKAAWTLDCN